VGTWAFFAPISLSQQGAKVLPYSLPDAAVFVLFFLATYTGPFLAAFLVTAATSGREGVRRLVGRILQWRVGVQWYLLVVLGYPLVWLVGLAPVMGVATVTALVEHWQLFFTLFLPNILVGLILPALGEETGWRGFALPRMQAQFGPLVGSVILGLIHGVWHTPAYFVPGAILPAGFDLTIFVANTVAITLATIIWTWIFNGAGGSILMAMVVHATSNANSALLGAILPTHDPDPWMGAKVMGVVAVLVIIATRGRLGYVKREE
jgi:membrane protease YdiL (CAAX protease family)